MSTFNPYHQWLGLQAVEKPTYYELLGVKLLESDPEKIRRGAKIQTRKLRSLDVGDREAARDHILDRIRRAVVCLTDAKKKADYDKQIRERIKLHQKKREQDASTFKPGVAKPLEPDSKEADTNFPRDEDADEFDLFADQHVLGTEATTAIADEGSQVAVIGSATTNDLPIAQPVAATGTSACAESTGAALPVLDEQLAARAVNRRRRIHRYLPNRRPNRLFLLLALVCVATLLGGGFLLRDSILSLLASGPKVDVPVVPNKSKGNGDLSGPQPVVVGPDSTIRADDNTSTPATTGIGGVSALRSAGTLLDQYSEPRPIQSAEELARLGGLLKEARRLLSERDIVSARDQLRLAETMLQRPGDVAMFNRLVLLTDYVEEYWKASRDGLDQLQAGDEFAFKGVRVLVVEKTSETLVLRVNGQNVQYPVNNLPIGLATSMANRWFDPTAPSTKVFQGAMMAVDPHYSANDARRLWREAAATGKADLNDLPQVLDDRYDLHPE